jgi:SulP family sulfate permease
VSLSFVFQILRLANRIEVREFEFVDGGFPVERPAPRKLSSDDVKVLSIRGSLFFASAQSLEAQLPAVEGARGATVILILRNVDDLGSTVIRLLKRYASSLQRQSGNLVLAGVDEELFGQLQRTGMVDLIGTGNIFKAQPEVGAALNEAIAASRRSPGGVKPNDVSAE